MELPAMQPTLSPTNLSVSPHRRHGHGSAWNSTSITSPGWKLRVEHATRWRFDSSAALGTALDVTLDVSKERYVW